MNNKISLEDLPPLIGPIKKTNKINFKELGFDDIDELHIEHFEEYYLDYDGFYNLLEQNNFDFGEFIEEVQHYQISQLANYYQEKKEYNKSIKLVSRKFDWLIDLYTLEEEYEKCADILDKKNKFIEEIKNLNIKYKTNYGIE